MSDCDVKVEDVKKLSGDTSTVQSFKVDVAYKDKDIVLNSDFWPQDIGCRPYFRRRGVIASGNGNNSNNIMSDILLFATYNCEGIGRSRDYINTFLSDTNCDILCVQETWHLDNNIHVFNNIHSDYLYTALSGIDSGDSILPGRPSGGVGIFYRKSLSGKVTLIKSSNRRICGVKINITSSFSCLLLSVYLPCDNYSNTVNKLYSDCIDYIESLLITMNCNAFICCGDYNSSFERLNAQTECLNNFMSRNNLFSSWNHSVSKKDFTYTNLSLNHFSCIDHCITSQNIVDNIVENGVIYEPTNLSNHNIVSMSIAIDDYVQMIDIKYNQVNKPNCMWSKATIVHIEQYQSVLIDKLSTINITDSILTCTDWHCECPEHRNEIDELCHLIIECCISASLESIPLSRPGGKDIPGWTDQVKPERDQSLFWHWMWMEAGKPRNGYIYDIMKRTKHRYHYAVRCCKRQKLEIQKQKLTENVSSSRDFWTEI